MNVPFFVWHESSFKASITKSSLNFYTSIMKKLILSTALVLGTLTMSAQTETKSKATTTTTTTTTQAPVEVEVKTADIPAPIMAAVKKDFPGAVVNSASVNAAKEYTLNVTSGEKQGLLYADASGKWITRE